VNEKENIQRDYAKTLKAAQALSKKLEKAGKEARLKQQEFEDYKKEQVEIKKSWEDSRNPKKTKIIYDCNNRISHYQAVIDNYKESADAYATAKPFLDEAIKKAEKINPHSNEDGSALPESELLATTKQLKKIINLIDPPFNYTKLPGIVLTGFGALCALGGLGLLAAVGKFALWGVYLAFVAAVPLALPGALIIGGLFALAVGIGLWYWAAKSDPFSLKNECKQLQRLNGELPTQDTLEHSKDKQYQSTLYFKVQNDGSIKARWYEKDTGIKDMHITDKDKCQEILHLYSGNSEVSNKFDAIVSIFECLSTAEKLQKEIDFIPTQLKSPLEYEPASFDNQTQKLNPDSTRPSHVFSAQKTEVPAGKGEVVTAQHGETPTKTN